MAVARPLPPRRTEEVSDWGWPDELRSWTWPNMNGSALTVRVYAAEGNTVCLMLNGTEIGIKRVSKNTKLTAEFEVPYTPGELCAIARDPEGQEVASVVFRTAGVPARLRLKPDRDCLRADRNDLSFVTVEVTDTNGNLIPDAVVPIRFQVKGAGELAAVGNANPQDVSSFRQPLQCRTFQGRCLAVLRPDAGPGGIITLCADAPELASAEAVVNTS